MCIIFINILSTVYLDIFVGTVKQIVKFIGRNLTTVTNSTYSSIPWNTYLLVCLSFFLNVFHYVCVRVRACESVRKRACVFLANNLLVLLLLETYQANDATIAVRYGLQLWK